MCTNSSSLESLPPEVISLINNNASSFFTSFSWYENFIQSVIVPDKNDYGFIIVQRDDGEISTIFPSMTVKLESGVKLLKSMSNYYSPIFEFVHGNDCNDKSVELIIFFKKLKKIEFKWDVLELRPLSKEDCSLVVDCLKQAGISSVSFFCFGNWYLELKGRSFDEYFSGLSSRVKNTVKRKSKKFTKTEGASVEIISEKTNIEDAIKTYEKVYNTSWKVEEPYPDFMPGLIKAAESSGALRLGIAYIGNDPIAVQLWIVADNSAYIFKLAYDENYKKLSAGTILTTTLMKHVIDVDKVEVVDYLCGDDVYKKEWMSDRRERWGVMAFNTSTRKGVLEMIRHKSSYYIKQCIEQIKKIK